MQLPSVSLESIKRVHIPIAKSTVLADLLDTRLLEEVGYLVVQFISSVHRE
jgi:hypothetical protein